MDASSISESELTTCVYTAPERFSISVRAFDTEDHAREFGMLLDEYVRALSGYFDLSQLDGVTVAFDYQQALLDLDRGYKTTSSLKASDGYAVGVAMTPSVLRDGNLKSHIVLNANVVLPLEDTEHKDYKFAFHLLAHECAHVEITHRFNTAFPGVLLKKSYADMREAFRWQIILASWDEYAATLMSARMGQDPTEGYEDTFLQAIAEARQKANDLIKAYRIHGQIRQILAEVYGVYGELMKFTAYHLGNMDGQGISLSDMPRTKDALKGHWYAPYFERLHSACKGIRKDYDTWTDKAAFEVIGDLADEILADGGVYVTTQADDSLYVDIPYSSETMPDDSDD